jgi:hypothetical protein
VAGLDPGCSHQPRYAVLTAGEAGIDKDSHYAGRTVCAITGFVAVLNRFEELGILTFMRAQWSAEPVIKTAGMHCHHFAKPSNRVLIASIVNNGVPYPDILAKYAAAFLRNWLLNRSFL